VNASAVSRQPSRFDNVIFCSSELIPDVSEIIGVPNSAPSPEPLHSVRSDQVGWAAHIQPDFGM
jgi:hypothetical protein